MNFTVADIFSGAGGLSEGFRVAGFEPIFAIDNDKDSIASHDLNFGCEAICEDVRNVSFEGIEATVVVAGPPCQPFSRLGNNGKKDPRRSLTLELVRAVKEIEPQAFLIENVPSYLKSTEAKTAIEGLKKLGYQSVYDVLNAYHYGVPQGRKRAFIVGSRDAYNSLPEPLGFRFSVFDAIGDLPLTPDGNNLHVERNPTELSKRRYRHVNIPGGNRFDLPMDLRPPCWRNNRGGSRDVFGRLWFDRPSVTIRTEFVKPEKGRYLHPTEHRPITVREGARLQTFSDDFQFAGCVTSIVRQIGNAVPPQMAFIMALSIRDHLEKCNDSSFGHIISKEVLVPFMRSRTRPKPIKRINPTISADAGNAREIVC